MWTCMQNVMAIKKEAMEVELSAKYQQVNKIKQGGYERANREAFELFFF